MRERERERERTWPPSTKIEGRVSQICYQIIFIFIYALKRDTDQTTRSIK